MYRFLVVQFDIMICFAGNIVKTQNTNGEECKWKDLDRGGVNFYVILAIRKENM